MAKKKKNNSDQTADEKLNTEKTQETDVEEIFSETTEETMNEHSSKEKEETDDNENEENDLKTSDEELESELKSSEKTILPRKRKIVKNIRLPFVIFIFAAALLTVVIWKCFFNQSVIGSWYYIAEGEHIETYDAPESSDEPESVSTSYSQRVCYTFGEDGSCKVTLGTTTVEGSYSIYSIQGGNIIAPMVVYQYTPVFYGTFDYEVTGNIFTGRKLLIHDDYGETLELEPGEGENPLSQMENFIAEEQLVGTWRDEEYGLTYTFTEDGFLTSKSDDGLTVEYAYTKFDDGYLIVKCYGNGEQADYYTYEFTDNKTYINGSLVEKVN